MNKPMWPNGRDNPNCICDENPNVNCDVHVTKFPTPSQDWIEEIFKPVYAGSSDDDSVTLAKVKITHRMNLERIKILNKAHRVGGTTNFDNATDEYIDELVAELEGESENG